METFDLEQALGDTSIPDDATLTFNGKNITFANLRGLTRKQQTALQAKIDAAAAKEREVSTQQETLIRLTQEAQQIHDRLQQQETTRPAPAAAAGDDAWDSDPFYKPVRERTSKLEKRLDEIADSTKKLTEAMTRSIQTWADDRWEREYDSISVPKGKERPKREDLLKYATDNRLVDRHGMPSVRAAWDKMTAADRQKEIEDAAYERGRQEGEQRARIAAMPQPATMSPGNGRFSGAQAPLESFDDLTAKALADPELRAVIAGTNLGVS
jgi:hypothetical protein